MADKRYIPSPPRTPLLGPRIQVDHEYAQGIHELEVAKKAGQKLSRKDSHRSSGKYRKLHFREFQLEFRKTRGLEDHAPIRRSPLRQELFLMEYPKGTFNLVSTDRKPYAGTFELTWIVFRPRLPFDEVRGRESLK